MKKILIIGGSTGIGLELVKLLSEQYQVFATYNQHQPEDIPQVSFHQVDVRETTLDLSFIPDELDGLVYCPGSISLKPFGRFSVEDFKQDYELNVLGAIRCIQHALPALKKIAGSSIVLFSTVAVVVGMPFHSLVSTSKGAIEGLCKSLAAEFAPTIRVNCVAPSLSDTPLAASLLSTEEKIIMASKRHPLKRIGHPLDHAQMVEFLLSEKSSWITGQTFHVDGGMSTLHV